MSSTTLVRVSGLALLLAGILIAVPILFHPSDADPQALSRLAWVPVHTAFVIAFLLSLFGLIGLYIRQRERSGWLGLIGFVLLFSGSALLVSGFFFEAFVLPAIAATPTGQALLDPAGPLLGGSLNVFFLLTSSIVALGSVLFGIAIFRAGTVARWAGFLLFGGPLAAFWPPLPQLVGTIGGVLIGLGYIWLGYALLRGAAERAGQAQATA